MADTTETIDTPAELPAPWEWLVRKLDEPTKFRAVRQRESKRIERFGSTEADVVRQIDEYEAALAGLKVSVDPVPRRRPVSFQAGTIGDEVHA